MVIPIKTPELNYLYGIFSQFISRVVVIFNCRELLKLFSDSFFKNMDQSPPLFVYFRYFLDTISIILIEKSIDGVLGI